MEKEEKYQGCISTIMVFIAGILVGGFAVFYTWKSDHETKVHALTALNEKNDILVFEINKSKQMYQNAQDSIDILKQQIKRQPAKVQRKVVSDYFTANDTKPLPEPDTAGNMLIDSSQVQKIAELVILNEHKDRVLETCQKVVDKQEERILILEQMNNTYKNLNNDLTKKNWIQKKWLKIKSWVIPAVAIAASVITVQVVK